MSGKSLEAKAIFWERISNCLCAFTNLLLGTGYWHGWTFALTWSHYSGAFVAVLPCCRSHDAASSASRVCGSHQLTHYGRQWCGGGHRNRLCPSSPAFQSCWAALRKREARWFVSWGFAGNEGNAERAVLGHIQAETAFGCRRCCIGVDHLPCSCVLTKTPCLGLRPLAERRILLRKACPSWCCTSSGKGLELYGRALQKSTDTGVSLPLFLWIHKALPANSTKSTSKHFLNNQRQRISAVKHFSTLFVN